MSVLLAQISASGSAEATFRVEEMVFPDMLKASFLSVSQLPEAKSCTEAAQPLLLLDFWTCEDLKVEYGKLKMRLVDLWAPWQKYYHYLTGILSLPDISELSKVEMNFLTILDVVVNTYLEMQALKKVNKLQYLLLHLQICIYSNT